MSTALPPMAFQPSDRLIEEVRRLRIAQKIQTVGDAETAAHDRSMPRETAGKSGVNRHPVGLAPLPLNSTAAASSTVKAKIDTQSSERQAGTTPAVEMRPRVGLRPTTLQKAAGIRPDPAVSVPRAKLTSPVATATADPELDPPGM